MILALACGGGVAYGQNATLVLSTARSGPRIPSSREAEAIAIEVGGSPRWALRPDMRKLAGPNCQIIDLKGRRVVPGFNDAHVHFLSGGSALSGVQLVDAGSPAELRRRIADFATQAGEGRLDQGRELGRDAVDARSTADAPADR